MAIYPGAVVRLIPRHSKQLHATQLILHTAVSGAASLYGYFSNPATDVCSHFYVREDGTVEQYVDTKYQAPANLRANTSAISVETWDGGNPDHTPWNAKQLATLGRLALWARAVHGIPLRLCTSPTAPGVGFHSMWGAPSVWTPAAGKTCPGPARIPQVRALLQDGLTHTLSNADTDTEEDFLSALTPDEQRELLALMRNTNGIVTRSGLGTQLTSLVDGKTKGYQDQFTLWADGKLDVLVKQVAALVKKAGA